MKKLTNKILGLLDFDMQADVVRAMNASFLKALAGETTALEFLRSKANEHEWQQVARFYLKGIEAIHHEIGQESIDKIKSQLTSNAQDAGKSQEKIWQILFPEACGIIGNEQSKVGELRQKREIKIDQLNEHPIKNPAKEILFTSNILVTLPAENTDINQLDLSENVRDKLLEIQHEGQLYWYDHPIQIGVSTAKNEAIYGIVGLNEAVEFEKNRGTIAQDDRVTLALSVSVTHSGLKEIVKEYLEGELAKVKGIKHLNIFIFTDSDTEALINEVITPSLDNLSEKENNLLHQVFGVDGEYGRHYSFLKAIAALWSTVYDKNIKATFKIDVDQIFPQRELVEQTGKSAFEHLSTPLWGALGTDVNGEKVEFGMLAGALVNQSDIEQGLFTPDVRFPQGERKLSEMAFYSALPQALSTQAEMMTRYQAGEKLDGEHYAIQRIHVTGGTNGILVNSLMKHRPFTPTFVGRAEDQAYILSTLYNDTDYKLRYAHKDGLIMRHDKQAFAQEAIKAAHLGKVVGDYVRILIFSYYAKALESEAGKTKELTGPFTGGFISQYPITVVTLRMALEALVEFEKSSAAGVKFVEMASKRLTKTLEEVESETMNLKKRFSDEKEAWNNYYDALINLRKQNTFSADCNLKAKQIIGKCNIIH